MPITTHQDRPGIAEVVIDHPPVNALDVAGWFGLAEAVTAAGRVSDTRVVVLRAEGKGFCAGVDIKEIQEMCIRDSAEVGQGGEVLHVEAGGLGQGPVGGISEDLVGLQGRGSGQ